MEVVTPVGTAVPACTNCAGTGTTIIAVIALVLIIILIIVGIVFFFFPSSETLLEVRGTNFIVINGTSSGGTGATGITGFTGLTGGTAASEDFPTGANNLYISRQLTGPLDLRIQPNSRNFVGMTIGVKNTSSSNGGTITLTPGSNVTLDAGGGGSDLLVFPGEFAWMVYTGGTNQTFLRLT